MLFRSGRAESPGSEVGLSRGGRRSAVASRGGREPSNWGDVAVPLATL